MNEIITVGQLMAPDPMLVGDQAPAERALRLLEEHAVSGLAVVDATGRLVGVVSESDVVRARATVSLRRRWPELCVADLMHSPALTADASMTLEAAAELMEKMRVHRLVVLDSDQERAIGVVSTNDLVRALAREPTDA